MKHLKAIVFATLALSLLACSLVVLNPTQAHASGCTPTIWTSANPTTAGDWVDAIGAITCGSGTNTIYIYTGGVAHGPTHVSGGGGGYNLPITYSQVSTTQQVKTQAEEITGTGQVYWSGIYYETVYRARNCQSGC